MDARTLSAFPHAYEMDELRDSEATELKVLVRWEEGKDGIGLGVSDDIWVKVHIDGKEGWIHSDEDLQAIGLYRAG